MLIDLADVTIQRPVSEEGRRNNDLAFEVVDMVDEVTLVYPPAGERQGRPRVRRRIAEMDADQSRLYDALGLAELAPR